MAIFNGYVNLPEGTLISGNPHIFWCWAILIPGSMHVDWGHVHFDEPGLPSLPLHNSLCLVASTSVTTYIYIYRGWVKTYSYTLLPHLGEY